MEVFPLRGLLEALGHHVEVPPFTVAVVGEDDSHPSGTGSKEFMVPQLPCDPNIGRGEPPQHPPPDPAHTARLLMGMVSAAASTAAGPSAPAAAACWEGKERATWASFRWRFTPATTCPRVKGVRSVPTRPSPAPASPRGPTARFTGLTPPSAKLPPLASTTPSINQSFKPLGAASQLVWGEKMAMLCAAAVSTTREAGLVRLNFFRAEKGVGW